MYITDTHPLVWYTAERYKKLSRKVKQIFDEAVIHRRTAIYVPTAALWEISLNLKADRDSIKLSVLYSEFVKTLFRIPTVIEEPVTASIVALSHDLNFHKDPFDTLIVATALEKQLPLITNDSVIHRTAPCELIWE